MNLPVDFSLLGQEVTVPIFQIRVNGTPLAVPYHKAITGVSVDLVTNEPCAFALQINDPKLELVDAEQGILAEGNELEIFMGYTRTTQSMITGEITSIGANLDEGGGLTLNVHGFDKLHAGTRGTGYREFREKKRDSDIVREIATDMHLTADVDVTEEQGKQQIQNHVSNLKYIKYLAKKNGFFFWVEGNKLMFKRSRDRKEIRVARGKNLISFSTQLSTSGQTSAVEVRGWDAAQKRAFSARAEATQSQAYNTGLSATGQAQIKGIGSNRSERIIYADGEVGSIAEAQRLADAELAKQQRALFSIQGSTIGNPDIRTGNILILEEMGRFSKVKYVVETALHEINQSGYRTSFTASQRI